LKYLSIASHLAVDGVVASSLLILCWCTRCL